MIKLRLALALVLFVPACTEAVPEIDDLATEDADLGELGAADAAGGLYTYYTARQDVRRCMYPLCGGYWVSRVNRAQTRCADGARASECYVAEIDFSGLGLSDDETGTLDGEVRGGRAILRGHLAEATIGDFTIGTFVPTEAWTAPRDFVQAGVLVRVEDSGIRCITYPCESLHEEKLNSSLESDIAELDLTVSGATEDEIGRAYEALAENGLIVAGYRYTVRGPAGRARARTATAFWARFTHRESAPGACYVGGCSSEVCSDDPGLASICEYRPYYACYRTATCERQPDGSCGWTETPELDACLAGSI